MTRRGRSWQLVAVAGLLGAAAAAQGSHDEDCTPGLGNRSFEVAGFFPFVFDQWEDFAGNVYQSLDTDGEAVPITGNYTCKFFGQFNGQPNATIIRQGLTAVEGELWEARLHSWQNDTDPIGPLSVAFASIEFFDAGRVNQLQVTSLDNAAPGGPTDIWEEWTISAVAPATAAEAVLTLGYFQGVQPPPPLSAGEPGAVFYDDVSLCNHGVNTGLVNADFNSYVPNVEFAADVCCVPGWTRPGAENAVLTREFVHSDNHALAMFGEGTGLENTVVLYQDLDLAGITLGAIAGDLVEGSAWAGQTAASEGGLIAGTNFAFMALQFLDGSDNLIEVTRARLVDGSSAPDAFEQGGAIATVPAGAAKARLLLGFFQEAGDPGPPVVQAGGAAFIDDAALASLGPNTGLINPSFNTFAPDMSGEPDPTLPLPGWSYAGFNGGVSPTIPNIGVSTAARTGEFAAYLFGQFPGDGSQNDTVVYQSIPVNPGEGLQVDAYAQQLLADPLGGSNTLSMNIEWRDGSDGLLGFVTTNALNASSPKDVYIPVSVVGTAPANTAYASIAFIYTQLNEDGGAAIFDDVSFAITPPPACSGDIDGDGSTGVFDFAILAANFGTTVPVGTQGDLDDDGDVDIFDFAVFAADFGCTP